MAQFTEGMIVYGCDVDGKSTGNTAVFTAPQGFVVFGIQVVNTNVSGVITPAVVSIGSNSSSYNNILNAAVLTNFGAVNSVLNLTNTNPSVHLQTDDVVYIKVSVAAIATSFSFQVLLIGYPL